MSKAILMLEEMPQTCCECPFYDNSVMPSCWAYMNFRGRTINFNIMEKERQHFCPLKPMPQKKEIKEIKHLNDLVDIEMQYDYIKNELIEKIKYDVDAIFNQGYNACIDEIDGKRLTCGNK